MKNIQSVILASKSPRRRELLGLLVEEFEVRVSEADESIPAGMDPAQVVELLACRKASVVAQEAPDALVIGADTMVVCDGQVLGKPCDEADAVRMLRLLSGRWHQVYTGVCMRRGMREEHFCCVTEVEFASLSEQEIAWYLSTGEPYDKAGGYGIQKYAARFIQRISGDYFNVMGLPVHAIYVRLGNLTR